MLTLFFGTHLPKSFDEVTASTMSGLVVFIGNAREAFICRQVVMKRGLSLRHTEADIDNALKSLDCLRS